jgi:tRNA modification GTPase
MHALRTDDVIVAISTPAGQAARGILRLTGPSAGDFCAVLFDPIDAEPLARHRPWRSVPGRLRLSAGTAVPCNAVVFLPPHSYTGQPMVEMHLAGSPALLAMALRAFTTAGARLAEPGEFTARAFLSGRMDLLSAEAVAERIAARSDAQLAAAQQLACGALAERSRGATEELTDLLCRVEAGIDFADEPIEFIDAASLARRLAGLAESLVDLLARSQDMQRLETLPRVALVGPPNAGKSRLLNRLSGLDRSICSPMPGTTRDILTAVMDTPTGQVLLLDGPGLGPASSDIDRLAQKQWREMLGRVDLLLLVLPADDLYDNKIGPRAFVQELAGQDVPGSFVSSRRLLVANKMDLLNAGQAAALPGRAKAGDGGVCLVSAATGAGCPQLQQAIGAAAAVMEPSAQGRIVLTARHSEALRSGLEAIRTASGEQSPELVALHLREAMMHLGQITGQVSGEDLLDRVFSRFCIGK